MLKTGSAAPEFILPDETGVEVSLSQLLQVGPLVLYFYPADFTPGCTKEACSIRDMHDDIMAVGCRSSGSARRMAPATSASVSNTSCRFAC